MVKCYNNFIYLCEARNLKKYIMMKFISFILMAGFAAFVIYLGKSAQKKARAASKAQNNVEPDSMVRMRQAKTASVRDNYDPSGEPSGIIPEPMDFGADELSESEITPLEEFFDENTSVSRKREIAEELRGAGCQVYIRGDFNPKYRPDTGEVITPSSMPKRNRRVHTPYIPEDGTDEQLDGPDDFN